MATILLVLLGILGASNIIIAKRPDAQEWIGKIAPFQGWIGALSTVLGAWLLVTSVFHLRRGLLHLVVHTGSGAVALGLGVVLGVGVLKAFINDPGAQRKLDKTALGLAPYQATLGVMAIAFALLRLVF